MYAKKSEGTKFWLMKLDHLWEQLTSENVFKVIWRYRLEIIFPILLGLVFIGTTFIN